MAFTRFLFSGVVNTTLTYGLYLLLLLSLHYTLSYTLAYLAGMACAYLMNRFFVFNSHQGLKSIVLLPLVYLIQYLSTLLIIRLWVEAIGFTERLAPLAAIVSTVPITYFLSKSVFRRTRLVGS